MANIPKEIVKRVTLTDLLEGVKEGKEFLNPLDEGRMKSSLTAAVYVRNVFRGLIRLGGDAALLYGVHEAYQTQDTKQVLYGTAMFLTAYLLDHWIYDRVQPPFWKKDEDQ
jgi:hypothetical protein